MNNAKIWLVVSPAVGVPVFLSAVAVGSFAVHVAVVNNTSWVSDFISGQPLGSGDQSASLTVTPDLQTAKVGYAVDTPDGNREITVILPDGTTATAVLQDDAVLASAAPPTVASH